MSTFHGSTSTFLLGAYDLTPYLNAVTPSDEITEVDSTTFGAFKKSIPGQVKAGFEFAGFFDAVAGGYSEALTAYKGGGEVPATLGYPTAVGDYAQFVNGWVGGKSSEVSLDGITTLDGSCMGQYGMDYGVWLHIPANRTSDANGTAVDNAAATTMGWAAVAHVFATTGAGPSTDLIIESSVDDTNWLTLGTFTTFTAAGYGFLSGTGSVPRYIRVRWDLGASTTDIYFAVAFARRVTVS